MSDILYPYDSPSSVPVSIVIAIVFCLGTISSLPLLYAIMREPATRTRQIDRANLIVILGAFIWSFFGAIATLRALVSGGFDAAGCTLSGSTLSIGSGVEVWGQSLMAYDRYCTIVLRKPLTDTRFNVICMFAMCVIFGISLLQLLPSFGYYPHDGSVYCYFALFSEDPKQLYMGIVIIIVSCMSCTLMLTGYYRIYSKIQVETKAASMSNVLAISMKAATSESSNVAAQSQQSKEHAASIRCFAILFVFLNCYGPEFAVCIYEAVMHRPVPALLGQLAAILSVSDTVLCPSLSIYFNKEYQHAIWHHIFGINTNSK